MRKSTKRRKSFVAISLAVAALQGVGCDVTLEGYMDSRSTYNPAPPYISYNPPAPTIPYPPEIESADTSGSECSPEEQRVPVTFEATENEIFCTENAGTSSPAGSSPPSTETENSLPDLTDSE